MNRPLPLPPALAAEAPCSDAAVPG